MDESLDFSRHSVDSVHLLTKAEAWSSQQVEDRLQDLVQLTTGILLSGDRSPESKLESMRWLSDKLLPLIPIYEVDESAYCPLLTAVLDLMDQVYVVLPDLEQAEEKVAMLTTAVTILEHAHDVVKHAGNQEGAGPGEIPSVPRLVPKILYNTYSYCGKERLGVTDIRVKEGLDTLVVKSKEALECFCGVMESMEIRSVLEDEMVILMDLCSSLVDFHEVLISIDFRSACRCWQLFARLTNQHAARLHGKLDISHTVRILSSQLNQSLNILVEDPDHLSEQTSVDKSKNANKQASIAAFMVKVLVKLADHYHGCLTKDMDEFLFVLLRLLENDYKLPDWYSLQLVDKIERDIFSPLHFSSLLRLSSVETLTHLLLTFWDKGNVAKIISSRTFSAVLLVIIIIEEIKSNITELTSNDNKDLLQLMFELVDNSGKDMIKMPSREGIPVMGNTVVKVNNYEWVLTHLCAWISTASPSEFSLVERCLFTQIQKPVGWSALLVCDIWCFVARYGTSQLCHAHITILSKIALRLPSRCFSSTGFRIKILIGRLFNFLGTDEQKSWMENFSPVESQNLCLFSLINQSSMNGDVASANHHLLYDIVHSHFEEFLSGSWSSSKHPVLAGFCLSLATHLYKEGLGVYWLPNAVFLVWRKLAEGPFSPSSVYWESEFFSNLVEATCAIVATHDSSFLSRLVTNLKNVLKAGMIIPYLLVGLAKILPHLSCEGGPRHGEETVTEIAELYRSLLSQSAREPHVHMEALEAFSLFAHSTQHEAVLGVCVETSVSESVKGFIGKEMEACEEESDTMCDERERLCDYKDELSEAVWKETVDVVDDEPRRKIFPSVPPPSTGSPTNKKRKLGNEKAEGDGKTEIGDIIKSLANDTDKLLNMVEEDKENKIEEDAEKQIASIISRLQTLVSSQSNQKEEVNGSMFSQSP